MGSIFNIQRFSLHDGPGIRTTVFFKGCPLNCRWCHNPESQQHQPELLFYHQHCQTCLSCLPVCSTGAIFQSHHGIEIDRNKCTACFKCLPVCHHAARKSAGYQITVAELLREICKDISFYEQSGGGVTFSGGEPLAQPDMLTDILTSCREYGISTAVDTCGYASLDVLKKVSPLTDLFLFDLKMLDDTKHRQTTGVSNKIILENLKYLIAQKKRIRIRIPVIPDFNNSVTDWQGLKEIISPDELEEINLLPYHQIGSGKYAALSRVNPMENQSSMSKDDLNELVEYFSHNGYQVKAGG